MTPMFLPCPALCTALHSGSSREAAMALRRPNSAAALRERGKRSRAKRGAAAAAASASPSSARAPTPAVAVTHPAQPSVGGDDEDDDDDEWLRSFVLSEMSGATPMAPGHPQQQHSSSYQYRIPEGVDLSVREAERGRVVTNAVQASHRPAAPPPQMFDSREFSTRPRRPPLPADASSLQAASQDISYRSDIRPRTASARSPSSG